MKVLILGLLSLLSAAAQAQEMTLANRALLCENNRAQRPIDIVSGSKFKAGYAHCDALQIECEADTVCKALISQRLLDITTRRYIVVDPAAKEEKK